MLCDVRRVGSLWAAVEVRSSAIVAMRKTFADAAARAHALHGSLSCDCEWHRAAGLHVRKAATPDEAVALVDEFAAAIEAVIAKASRDMGLAIANILSKNPGAFVAGGSGPEELWRELYQKPIEDAWRAYASQIMSAAGAMEFERLFGDAAFNLTNRHALRFLEGRGAELVRNITAETRAGVRAIVRDMIRGGAGTKNVGSAVSKLGDLVGLSERDTRAVISRVAAMRTQGVSESVIAREQQKMVDRYLERRGHLIARTEGMRAEAEGVMSAWKQATDDGLLPKGATRKWIAEGPNVCVVCLDLEKLAPVGLDQPFFTKEHGAIWAPPAHPACRCVLGLVPPAGWG